MDGTNYLVAIGNAMACGEYDAISECFFEYGLGSNIAITLPYGFTLEVEPIDSVSDIAWDNYSMGIISSLMTDCGSVVLSLGRLEVQAFKLVRIICLFGKDFGLQMFVGPDNFLYTEAGQNILRALKCNNVEDLLQMALDAVNAIFYDQCQIPIEIHTFEELPEIYQTLCSMGFVKQMLTFRTANNRWLYPCANIEEMAHFWCTNYNLAHQGVMNGTLNPLRKARLAKALSFLPNSLKVIILNKYVVNGYIYYPTGGRVGIDIE